MAAVAAGRKSRGAVLPKGGAGAGRDARAAALSAGATDGSGAGVDRDALLAPAPLKARHVQMAPLPRRQVRTVCVRVALVCCGVLGDCTPAARYITLLDGWATLHATIVLAPTSRPRHLSWHLAPA